MYCTAGGGGGGGGGGGAFNPREFNPSRVTCMVLELSYKIAHQ